MDGALPTRVPAERVTVEPEQASPARIYDWLLGGSHNFAIDREVGAKAMALMPQVPLIARSNRHFLRRAVAAVAQLGVDQYLDLGSGIPTVGNVHEVAREFQPEAKVVYVDLEPVAVEHSRAILRDDPNSRVVHADLLDARRVLTDSGVRELLDFDRPICLLLVGVGHFIPDTHRLTSALAMYRDALPAGSYFVMSHGTSEARPEQGAELVELYRRNGTILVDRNRMQLTALLHGWEPIPPGLVYAPEWRVADDEAVEDPADYNTLAVVAAKP